MAEQQNTPEFINDPTGHDEDAEDAVPLGSPKDNSIFDPLEHNSVPAEKDNSVPAVELNGLPNSDYLKFSKKLLKSRAGAEYNMRHERRGPALIFNQIKFEEQTYPLETPKERRSSDLDVSAFQIQLEGLGFDVQQYVDNKKADLIDKIQKLAKEDHTQNDCILIAIFSHGSYNGEIWAHDTTFNLNEILEKFTDENCPTLKGKPKLFFLQVCQGLGKDLGGQIEECKKMKKRRMERNNELLQHPDFLIAHPSAHGLESYRRLGYGSWFIQGLCNVLGNNGTNLDLITILTYVSRYVARHETTDNKAKQVPCFTSMLTRIVRFDHKKKHQPGTKH